MRSRGRRRSGVAVHACAWLFAVVAATATSAQETPSRVERPGPEAIARAIEAVKADPNLSAERTIKTMRWKGADTPPSRSERPAWASWVIDLVGWIAQGARALTWTALAIGVVLLAAYLVRVDSLRRGALDADGFVAPTHVRELDIRPESLPDDVGTTARALWDGGERRAALSLLYRGLLSRLAHVHRVPIRESTTEGDCLRLAEAHVVRGASDYTASLVPAWQRFVYGGEDLDTGVVHDLCARFSRALDEAPAAAGSPLRERTA